MIYKEELKDIFKVKNVDVVAQCIAQDAHMGAGIAVTFKQRYPNMQKEIQESKPQYPTTYLYNEGRKDKSNRPPVLNLITKPSSYNPPTFDDFKVSMSEFRDVVINKGYKTIAIPMIGAGLDRLSWKEQVLPTIHETFDDLDVELTVYFVENNSKNMQ